MGEVAALVDAVGRDQLKVVPFVLSNMALGAGYPRDNTAVVDLTFLSSLLGRGGIRQGAVVNRDGLADPGTFKKFYNSQAEAEVVIPDLMRSQPAIQTLLPLVKRRQRPMPISVVPSKISEVYFSVTLDSGEWDFEAQE
jgi:hypothetical protein